MSARRAWGAKPVPGAKSEGFRNFSTDGINPYLRLNRIWPSLVQPQGVQGRQARLSSGRDKEDQLRHARHRERYCSDTHEPRPVHARRGEGRARDALRPYLPREPAVARDEGRERGRRGVLGAGRVHYAEMVPDKEGARQSGPDLGLRGDTRKRSDYVLRGPGEPEGGRHQTDRPP